MLRACNRPVLALKGEARHNTVNTAIFVVAARYNYSKRNVKRALIVKLVCTRLCSNWFG